MHACATTIVVPVMAACMALGLGLVVEILEPPKLSAYVMAWNQGEPSSNLDRRDTVALLLSLSSYLV